MNKLSTALAVVLVLVFSNKLDAKPASIGEQGSGRTFYVQAGGDDSADGLSPERAWRSLDRVNHADLSGGDRVLFRRGDVFRGHLEPKSGRSGAPVYYGPFGEGEKPKLQPSYDASSASSWTEVRSGIWRCLQPSSKELGNIILDHGDSGCAWKVDRMEQLDKDLRFCWIREEGAVYLVSSGNPAHRFKSIELAENVHVISETSVHDVVYEGLWLRYGAAHGIGGSGVKHITVKGCDVSWIGGGTNYIDEEGRCVRFGNGIEFWSAAEDVLVENCRIWECWDAGLTNQSNKENILQKNITWRGNEVWNCEYSFEYWQQGDGSRTENIVFENNVCRDAGKGWGHHQRWNPNAAHLMLYDTTAETDGFIIRGNRFEHTENCCIRLFNAWYRGITMEDNVWIIPRNQLIRYHGRPTSGLINKYPDHLDFIHRDDVREIEDQVVEKPLVLGHGRRAVRKMAKRFGFR
ncbi:MAG: right-handed parallel beta-helix repeat-containing protein [Bacteroidales bacterium]|nr:right-handed parallel beta-helix repeat-containing protein [Bacteroidales bacterium]